MSAMVISRRSLVVMGLWALWAWPVGADGDKKKQVEVDPEARYSAFKESLREGEKRRVKKMMEAPDFFQTRIEDGKTPIFALAYAKDEEMIALVLERRPDLTHQDTQGFTVLHFAAQRGNGAAVKGLLASGADAAATDPGGRPALIHAAVGGHVEATRALIEAGADVDATDRNGASALVYAAAKGYYDVPRLLLEAGADPNLSTESGETALALARRENAQRLERLLRRHGAR